jgi:hypothetical protein
MEVVGAMTLEISENTDSTLNFTLRIGIFGDFKCEFRVWNWFFGNIECECECGFGIFGDFKCEFESGKSHSYSNSKFNIL